MSNEYKAWIEDRVAEVLFDAGALTYVDEIWPEKLGISRVAGRYIDEEREYEVWFDASDDGEWRFKRIK